MLAPLLTLALLAQAPTSPCAPRPPLPEPHRLLQLPQGAVSTEHCFYVAPNTATAFLFDAPVRVAPRVEDAERFTLLLGDGRTLALMPKEPQAGDTSLLRVDVEYTDGALPGRLTLWLVVDELLAEHKVVVHREALPPPALAAKLRDTENRLNVSQQENAQLHTGLAAAEGLVGALVTEMVDERGILALPQPTYTPRRATPVVATEVVGFRAAKRLLVSMKLAPGAAAREGEPFEVEEALLVDAKGRRRAVLRTKQAAPSAGGVRFALEAEAVEIEPPTSWWLRLRGKGEATFFTVAEVSFPQLP